MKKFALAGVLVTMLAGAALLTAQDAPPPGSPPVPPPTPATQEHAWLHQAVGEWDSEAEVTMGPGQPPMKCKGTETVRAIGKLWTVAEHNGTFMDVKVTGILTLGYDPEKKKYVGTWVDSMTSHLWKYEGTVDAAGKALTLETEGPNPAAPGTMAKFKEVLEFKSKDHKVFTSSMQGEDGKWVTFMTANYRRKN